jgi:sugar phosphate permease
MPLLFISYVISYIDRVNVGFAKLQMLDDLHFSAAVYGLGAGVFFIGFILFEIPSNLFLHRFGARLWLACIMVTWGILSMLMVLISTSALFYALRFLLGAAEAGFIPGAVYYLTQWYPRHRRGRVFSLLIMGASAGGVIVGPLSGWIMSTFQQVGALRSWQWLFLLQGGPAVLMGVLLFHGLSDSPARVPWLTPEERERLAASLARPADEAPGRTDLNAAFATPRVWLLGFVMVVINMGIYAGVFWLPTTIRAAGIANLSQIGLISALPYLAAALLMWVLGRSSDFWCDRRWHCAIAMVLASAGLLVEAWGGRSPMVSIGSLTVSIAFLIGCTPLMWVQAGEMLAGRAAAAGFAFLNVFAGAAGFFAAYAMGLAQDHLGGTSTVSCAIAVLVVLGSLTVLRVRNGQGAVDALAPAGQTSKA